VSDIYRADPLNHIRSVVLNGTVVGPDPATGVTSSAFVLTFAAERDIFTRIDLSQVDALRCLEALRGVLSQKADQMVAVRPIRLVASVAGQVAEGGDDDVDLLTIDPLDFEDLIARLFEAMGYHAATTQRSGDGGVDVLATDLDPVRGGRIVIQVKRYAHTVNPAAVRDLFGAVAHEGAMKGILVTTSGFGPGSREFADGKPLTLIDGPELVNLLHQHGLEGHLGSKGPASSTYGRHAAQ